MSDISPVKKGESLISGKVLVTCTVTIFGLWSHSELGKRGLMTITNGLNRRPTALSGLAPALTWVGTFMISLQCALIWTKKASRSKPGVVSLGPPGKLATGMRPPRGNGNEKPEQAVPGQRSKAKTSVMENRSAVGRPSNGHGTTSHQTNGSAATDGSEDLDQRILEMERVVGTTGTSCGTTGE